MIRHLSSEQLSAYLDGEVAPSESREIESHLGTCEDCCDRLEAMQGAVSMVWRLDRATPPPSLAARVRSQVAMARRPQPPVRRFVQLFLDLPYRPVLRTGTAAGLALVLSLFLVTGVGPRRPGLDEPLALDEPGRGVVTVESVLDAPLVTRQTTSKVAGREFVWTETQDLWVQRGLEGKVPESRVSVQSPKGQELLARYSDLGLLLADGSRVVLRYRLATVELSQGV